MGLVAERVCDLIEEDLMPQPFWIAGGVLPKRGTLLFGGLEKIGKSLIGLEVARAVSTGTPLFGYPLFATEKARVLIVEMEVGKFGLKDRAKKVFEKEDVAEYGDFFWYISQETGLRLDTEEGIKCFIEVMDQIQPNILILDPISNLHSQDENSNTEVGNIFYAIDYLKNHYQHTDLSVILSHHMGKKAVHKDSKFEADPLDHHNFRGALRWTAAPDTICTAHRHKEIKPKAWELQIRWLCRHAAPPPEMSLIVNQKDDLRVVFEKEKGELRPLSQIFEAGDKEAKRLEAVAAEEMPHTAGPKGKFWTRESYGL